MGSPIFPSSNPLGRLDPFLPKELTVHSLFKFDCTCSPVVGSVSASNFLVVDPNL